MEVPDVLVVTKADMGDAALRTRRDLAAAARAVGSRDTPVLAVSSLPPATGIEELVAALDAHREAIDVAGARARARRLSALSAFAAEHGDAGLRSLGGRREAERVVAKLDAARSVPELVKELETRAKSS
jgi:LAO/AO transport system kinase